MLYFDGDSKNTRMTIYISKVAILSLRLLWYKKQKTKNKTRQHKAIQGNTRQYKAIQGNTRQYKAIQGNTRQYKAINKAISKATQGNTRHHKTIQGNQQGNTRQWGDIQPVIIVSFKTSHQFSYSYQDNRTNVSSYFLYKQFYFIKEKFSIIYTLCSPKQKNIATQYTHQHSIQGKSKQRNHRVCIAYITIVAIHTIHNNQPQTKQRKHRTQGVASNFNNVKQSHHDGIGVSRYRGFEVSRYRGRLMVLCL